LLHCGTFQARLIGTRRGGERPRRPSQATAIGKTASRTEATAVPLSPQLSGAALTLVVLLGFFLRLRGIGIDSLG